MGVVGRELRIDPVGQRQELFGADDIRHIGRRLAGEHGKPVQTQNLCALYFRVPVSALHQPAHDPPVEPGRKVVQPVDDAGRSLAVGLHHDAEAVPPGKRRIGEHGFDHVERKIEPVRFLRIDVQTHARRLCRAAKIQHPGRQFRHHAVLLHRLVAGMQGRQLDGNTGIAADIVVDAGRGKRVDRAGIGVEIAGGVRCGARGLAQHVIGIGKALLFPPPRTVHRFGDIAAHDELAAKLAHGAADGGADNRLAQPAHGRMQRRRDAGRVVVAQDGPGDHQRPGRGVDQRRRRAAQMFAPGGGRDLVLNQSVYRVFVRHPQQGFGKAHQGDAFVGRQAEFV